MARFQRILAAAILEADPEAAREREERARTTRDVYAFDSEDGLRTVVARAASGDVAWFLATVNRIAEILAAEGDPDPVGARRSKAMGILASPARALQLLINHRSDRSDAAPAGPTPAEPGDRASADAEDQPADDLDHEEPGPDPSEPNEDTSVSLSTSWPDARDFRAARPRVVLHFHLSEEAIRSGHGVVRPEHGEVITLNQLREFLRDAGCRVTVQPVIDPARTAPIDGYEVSPRLRAAVRYREPAEVFPYGTCLTRNMDLDHTKPYVPRCRGGPPGQTSLANLGPLSRSPHRVVTHGGWGKRQPDPGRYLFRSPSGRIFLVTNQGTQDLGSTPFAATVWRAAAPAARTPPQRS